MDSDEPDVQDMAPEGINTLAAQATRQSIERIITIIKRERTKGVSNAILAKAMEKSLGDFDKHSRELLLKIANGQDVPDDFPPAIVQKSEQVKANTMELTLTEMPKQLQLFSLVRHNGTEWLIVESKGKAVTLKMLQ